MTGVWDLGGLRLIALDTSGARLASRRPRRRRSSTGCAASSPSPAPLGTILAMHHPPLPSHVPLFDILELRDQGRLAEAIAGTDVRAILAGHLHYSTSGTFAGIPVSVAAATCYTMDLARPAVEVNGMDAGQSFHLVHVYDDTITHAVVPVVDAPTGDYFSAEWVERMSATDAGGAARGVLAQAADRLSSASPATYTSCARLYDRYSTAPQGRG